MFQAPSCKAMNELINNFKRFYNPIVPLKLFKNEFSLLKSFKISWNKNQWFQITYNWVDYFYLTRSTSFSNKVTNWEWTLKIIVYRVTGRLSIIKMNTRSFYPQADIWWQIIIKKTIIWDHRQYEKPNDKGIIFNKSEHFSHFCSDYSK